MINSRTLCTWGMLLFCLPMFGQYAHLKEKLDNDYLTVTGGTIKFTYQERYAIVANENDEATCRIYDSQRHLVGPEIIVANQYGLNEHEITLPLALMNVCAYYILEVTGTNKGEVYYLRFKLEEPTLVTVTVSAKAFLSGSYDPATGLMDDGLRAKEYIPLQEPYSQLGYSIVINCVNDQPTTSTVLSITGPNAIIDWVFLELRPECDPHLIFATRAALIQADGDVVDVDGVSPVSFCTPAGNYHLSIRHRNHLRAMTAATYSLANNGDAMNVDLTSSSTSTWGNFIIAFTFQRISSKSQSRQNAFFFQPRMCIQQILHRLSRRHFL